MLGNSFGLASAVPEVGASVTISDGLDFVGSFDGWFIATLGFN